MTKKQRISVYEIKTCLVQCLVYVYCEVKLNFDSNVIHITMFTVTTY